MDSWRRRVFAAKNPSVCALFFDFMIRKFIEIILRHGTGEPGLFGICEAYYGAVEAQGKGTLHVHMVVWLKGHLSPQRLHDVMLSSEEYKKKVFEWLESIIMNKFPVVSGSRDSEPSRSSRLRSRDLGLPHPGTIRGPTSATLNNVSEDEFWISYHEYVIGLLHEYNWHEHNATCWKYLKHGQEKNDRNCRMRMDGSLYPETFLDPVTGALYLRRLHPAIASYNDLATFLMKCNMNIQFIGSGDAAKAYMYYITDYVSKPTVPMHVGLAALSCAIKKTNDKRTDDQNEDSPEFCTKALTTVVNSMMGRQEISHQQVMSYLVGGGDYYTSETFQVLNFGAFSRYVTYRLTNGEATLEIPSIPQHETPTGLEEQVYLAIEEGEVSISSQIFDYAFRPLEEPYDSMCLYEFTACTVKGKITGKTRSTEGEGRFSSWDHPQRANYRMYLRKERVLPVILGPTIANPSRSSGSKELWSRDVLILYKPWREPDDIKDEGDTWTDAFDEFKESGEFLHEKIVQNMTVLTEGADARFIVPRHTDHSTADALNEDLRDGLRDQEIDVSAPTSNEELDLWRETHNSDVFRSFDRHFADVPNAVVNSEMIPAALRNVLGRDVTELLTMCFPIQSTNRDHEAQDNSQKHSVRNFQQVSDHSAVMSLKRKRRTANLDDVNEEDNSHRRRNRRRTSPFADVHRLLPERDQREMEVIVQEIIQEQNLGSNKEQLKAFMTVADHVLSRDPTQLLMHVSGVGGTGKSHVIKSIVKLFERLDVKNSLLLGAPTGIAAVLIEGHTLHSLILASPGNKKRKSKNTNYTVLIAVWKGVRYLIIDEVSMVGARFLSQLSNTIRQAKGDDPINSKKPFGGVNVIFMGDFCQLKPPLQKALYSSVVINNPSFEESKDAAGISAMNGVFLWRQVHTVVELVKNLRHGEDEYYSRFLSRLRVGECVNRPTGHITGSDYEYLQSRLISKIHQGSPWELPGFSDAPIIVGTKALRDALNAQLVEYHAARLNVQVHTYYSHDSVKRDVVPLGAREYLWSLKSSENRDSFGRLPLFEGMKVMVTENIAFDSKIVNGTEGVVRQVIYKEDVDGRRYASVVYVYVEGSGFNLPGLDLDVVPIFPTTVRIESKRMSSLGLQADSFSRVQLPLVPAYAYTDFKAQGRTLEKVMVDLVTARGQGVYVMLSRVKTLSGLAILRWFPTSKIYFRLPQELRQELTRLELLM